MANENTAYKHFWRKILILKQREKKRTRTINAGALKIITVPTPQTKTVLTFEGLLYSL